MINLQQHFIDYWDDVIRQWLSLNADVTSFKNDASEQSMVIEAINENCKNKKGVSNPNYKINTNHMPEPYWGNPLECSIVLLDYNPAGGPDDNCHTTIGYKDDDKNGMKLIKYVKDNSYSQFAQKGSVFRDEKDLNENGMGWFCAEKEDGGK